MGSLFYTSTRNDPRRLSDLGDRSEDGGKSSLVFRLFERSAEAEHSGDYVTKTSGKIGRFPITAVD